MNSHVNLIRMDSASYTCCYGNDIYSFQVRFPKSAVIFFPGDIQDSESHMYYSIYSFSIIGVNLLLLNTSLTFHMNKHFKYFIISIIDQSILFLK